MARKNKDEEETTGTEGASEPLPDVNPDGEGWGQVNPYDGERFFFRKNRGACIQGILLGRYARKDDADAHYYQIKLTKGSGDLVDREGESVVKEVGTVVTIDESSALRDLEPLTREKPEDGKVCEVFIRALEKLPLAGGKSFWRFSVKSRRAKEKDLLPF